MKNIKGFERYNESINEGENGLTQNSNTIIRLFQKLVPDIATKPYPIYRNGRRTDENSGLTVKEFMEMWYKIAENVKKNPSVEVAKKTLSEYNKLKDEYPLVMNDCAYNFMLFVENEQSEIRRLINSEEQKNLFNKLTSSLWDFHKAILNYMGLISECKKVIVKDYTNKINLSIMNNNKGEFIKLLDETLNGDKNLENKSSDIRSYFLKSIISNDNFEMFKILCNKILEKEPLILIDRRAFIVRMLIEGKMPEMLKYCLSIIYNNSNLRNRFKDLDLDFFMELINHIDATTREKIELQSILSEYH